MTDTSKKSSEDLQHIRSMMERSSRFISLNGFAGVTAGIIALISGFIAKNLIHNCDDHYMANSYCEDLPTKLMALAFLTIILSLGSAVYFTVRKSRKKNLPIWTESTRNTLIHLGIPLVVGMFVIFAFYMHNSYAYIIPSMLLFYGLGLISASSYTFGDIKYLGICEVILGLIGLYYFNHNYELWMLGFGVLHIIYGVMMYRKYG